MKLLLMLFSLSAVISTAAQNKDELAIRNVLQRQVSDWNKGNIEGYMKGYWENDSLLFVGKSGPKYGYTNTFQAFKKSYPAPAAMGKLGFEIIKMKQLAADCYFVMGKWTLQQSVGDLGGYFTLLFKKINNQWVIITDHSS